MCLMTNKRASRHIGIISVKRKDTIRKIVLNARLGSKRKVHLKVLYVP